ncbi:PAS domain S-box protein [Lachnospiraceae bacterium MD329]|nr:PAS domain S-box protein [Lachnospiraceae bacterium MD329]
MNSKIFRSSFFTTFLVLIAAIVFIMGILFDVFEKQIQREAATEAEYLARAVESEGADFLSEFNGTDRRITLIDADGNVLFDNQTNADTLDNHAKREEIKQAMETGKGMSIRYSKTLTEKTLYYAVKLSDSSILRVSTNQYTVFTILLGLLQPIILILVIALILTAVLSSRVSKAIIKPINELDLEYPDKNETYEELTPLLRKISEQKRTISQQLAEAKKKQNEFNLITENMNEGFLIIDKDTNILTHNGAALKLLGIENPASDSALALCRTKEFREVVTNSLSSEKAQSIMKQNDRAYSLIASPVFENENVIGAVIIIIDITEIEKREEMRREFTANVSHELKTPLTSISGFAELMKNGGVPNETVTDFSKSIYDEAQRLISLVNDIIKISELDEKSISLESEKVDLYELSNEIIDRLKSEAAKKNVTLNNLVGINAEIVGIRKILDKMIYNLCDNAIKYNKENGTVDIIVSGTDKKISVIVRDTGIGIPPEHQSRVFERFYRVDKSHSKKVGGTGLGLAIVKHGAMYHNADISLESTEGKGTSIKITFDKN